jgi:hypothetical protein
MSISYILSLPSPTFPQLIKQANTTRNDAVENLADLNDVVEYIGDTVPPLFAALTHATSTTSQLSETEQTLPCVVEDMLQKVLIWSQGKKKFEVCAQ